MRSLPRLVRLGAIGVFAFSTAAAAQETPRTEGHDPKLAQSLFDRARELMDKGDFAHACPLFVESQRLDPGGGTLLNIALCHEREGKIATAWAEYGEALSVATRDGRDDRRDQAQEHIEALRPRLPKIRIVAKNDVNVTLDGRALPAVSVGLDLPVDPGAHSITASAKGKRSWSASPTLVEAQLVEITVPELAVAADAAATSPTSESSVSPVSWVLGGVAVVAVGTSVVTGLMALGAERDAKDKCVPDRSYCPDPSYADDASRARTLAWVSTGALVVGIGAAVSALLWPRERSVGVSIAPTSAGAFASARLAF